MTVTREYIEAILSDPPSENIRALCELALRALRYESVNPSDFRYWEGRYRDEAAENERLRGELMAMVRTAIRGKAHDDGDYTATFTMHELHRARRALERKPE